MKHRQPGGNPRYSPDSVTRALTHHQATGSLRAWTRTDDPVRFLVTASDGQTYTFTLSETYAFVVGLASAAQARPR
jgi:hypothetical protein